jgi:hypothetical protein
MTASSSTVQRRSAAIADQPYVTYAVGNAVARLLEQSRDLYSRCGAYQQMAWQDSAPNVEQINFTENIKKNEMLLFKVQQGSNVGVIKDLMGQVSKDIIAVIAGMYVIDFVSAETFKARMEALQYACYIQKRYQYRNDTERSELINRLNGLLLGENIGKLENNPNTFAGNIAQIIGKLLNSIKKDLPKNCLFGEELVDQIAGISSFDGGTSEISAHRYNVSQISPVQRKPLKQFDMSKFMSHNLIKMEVQ